MVNRDNIAKAAVVLSSAYLLPPRHAALYILGGGAMSCTSICDFIEGLTPSLRKPNSRDLIYTSLRFLSRTLPQCALFYCATALFKQPINEFLNLKGINGTASQFIVSGAIRTIVSTLFNTDQNHPSFHTPSTINICIQGVTIAAFLYFTEFDKNYPRVFATTSIALVLLEKVVGKNFKSFLTVVVSESFAQLCVDKMGVDLFSPTLFTARLCANIAVENIINMVPSA